MDLVPVPKPVAMVAAAALDGRARRGGGGSARGVTIATALTTGWISAGELEELRAWHHGHPDDIAGEHSTLLGGLYGGAEARESWEPCPIPARTAAPGTPSKLAKMSKSVNNTDRRLVNALHSTANLALKEALRGAGVKLKVKVRNRTKVQQASLDAALERGVTPAILAAVGVTENDLLDHRFDTYGASALALISTAERKKLAALARALDVDPAELEARYGDTIDLRAAAAVGFIVGALGELARSALAGTSLDSPGPGEFAGPVPFGVVRNAFDVLNTGAAPSKPDLTALGPADVAHVSESTRFAGDGRTLVETVLGDHDVRVQLRSTWVHGDPDIPFPPHEALDGLTWVDTQPPELDNPDSFPETDVYQPGDHEGCTCWIDQTYEPYEGDSTIVDEAASTLAGAVE